MYSANTVLQLVNDFFNSSINYPYLTALKTKGLVSPGGSMGRGKRRRYTEEDLFAVVLICALRLQEIPYSRMLQAVMWIENNGVSSLKVTDYIVWCSEGAAVCGKGFPDLTLPSSPWYYSYAIGALYIEFKNRAGKLDKTW